MMIMMMDQRSKFSSAHLSLDIIKIDALQKMSGLVVSKMETPKALLVDGKPMPKRLLFIEQNLISKDFK